MYLLLATTKQGILARFELSAVSLYGTFSSHPAYKHFINVQSLSVVFVKIMNPWY